MKIIILAAGQGSRLRPLTNNKPKCMVQYKNKPLIDYLMQTAKTAKINDIAVIGGYKFDVLKNYLNNNTISYFENKNYLTTNMLYTLFTAEEFMDQDIIISYSDIIYKQDILNNLIDSKEEISVVIDKKWKLLWEQRMENPLEDAETLKIKDNKIIEIGKKPSSYEDIEGQYIGLIKISHIVINEVIAFYKSLKTTYNEEDFQNLYMTDFLQLLIENNYKISPLFIEGGWIEIDSEEDLKVEIIS